jgi:hypothetical protein
VKPLELFGNIKPQAICVFERKGRILMLKATDKILTKFGFDNWWEVLYFAIKCFGAFLVIAFIVNLVDLAAVFAFGGKAPF